MRIETVSETSCSCTATCDICYREQTLALRAVATQTEIVCQYCGIQQKLDQPKKEEKKQSIENKMLEDAFKQAFANFYKQKP